MRVAYKRVSTVVQNTARQLQGIEVDKVFEDKVSGKNIDQRIQLKELLEFVRAGDSVIVHSMDRLGRNLQDLLAIVNTLTVKGVEVVFVKENLTFKPASDNNPMNKLLLGIMGAISEFERELILERQKEGIEAAKLRGAYKGRKPVDLVKIHDVYNLAQGQHLSIQQACKQIGISPSTYYKCMDKQ